jgi:hypothetical protein
MRIRQLQSSVLGLLFVAGLAGACGGGGTDSEGGSGGGTSEPCGEAGEACSADQFCDYQYNSCGPPAHGGEDPGECRPRAGGCDDKIQVCGCDGKVHPSECAAHAEGVDIGERGFVGQLCADSLTPAGTFPCGPFFCVAAESYCDYGEGDTGDRTTVCTPLPAACNGVATCGCVPADSPEDCEVVNGNGVTGIKVTEVFL